MTMRTHYEHERSEQSAGIPVDRDLSFTSAWWRRWREFSRPITERIKARPMEYRKIYRDRYSLCISDADAPTFCPLVDPWVPCRPFVEHLIGYLRL